MALPHSFAAVTSATGQQLDDNFAADGALTTVFSTAAGANSIVLTPAANAPAVTAYGLPYPYRFSFVAAGTSSASVTIAVGALSALPLYLPTGVQAGSADLQSGFYYEVAYVSSLNSGSGGFQLVSAIPTATAVGIGVSVIRALTVTNNAATPSTKVDITALSAAMVTSSGAVVRATSISVTIDLTTTGVNGMDTGSRPTSGWVYNYLISNGTLTRGLATITSPLSGTPSLPVGYTYSAYCGAMYCDASQNLKRTKQLGRTAQYTLVAATNTASAQSPGTSSGTSWTALSISLFVPPTTSTIFVGSLNSSATGNGGVAPNNLYATGAPAANMAPVYFPANTSGGAMEGSFLLESTNIYAYASVGTTTALVYGWVDYASSAL